MSSLNLTTKSFSIILFFSSILFLLAIDNPIYGQNVPEENDNIDSELNSQSIQNKEIKCGDILEGNVTLSTDLNCNGDGVSLGANTNLFLNGHSIQGPSSSSDGLGVFIFGQNSQVNGPGTISNFRSGIIVQETYSIKVSQTTLKGNGIGLFVSGSGDAEISNNVMENNDNIGLASHSSNKLNIVNNTFQDNSLAGISFVTTKKSNVEANEISGAINGISLAELSYDNTFKSNVLKDNGNDVHDLGIQESSISNIYLNNVCENSLPDDICEQN